MAHNLMGLTIDYICNNCSTKESSRWYKDKVKGIGWKCAACYLEFTRAKARYSVEIKRMPMVQAMEIIFQYLVNAEKETPNSLHTIATISKATHVNYNTVHRALKLIQNMQNTFFNNYNLNVRGLKTVSNSNREKMRIVSIAKRKQ